MLLTVGVILPLPPNPKSVEEALQGEHADKWEAAITKELDQFRLRNTFGPAEQEGNVEKDILMYVQTYEYYCNMISNSEAEDALINDICI